MMQAGSAFWGLMTRRTGQLKKLTHTIKTHTPPHFIPETLPSSLNKMTSLDTSDGSEPVPDVYWGKR
jgi:hypothetical protein